MKLSCGHEFEEKLKRCPVCRPAKKQATSKTALLLSHLSQAHLPMPVEEHYFSESRKYRFDLAWPERMLAVEVEGGIWSRGRHNRPAGYEEDCRKYNYAQLEGWKVLRFTSDQVKRKEAIRLLTLVLCGKMDASSTKHLGKTLSKEKSNGR